MTTEQASGGDRNRFGDFVDEDDSELFREPGAIYDVVRLAWKLLNHDDLDAEDQPFVALVNAAVIGSGWNETTV